MDNHVVMAGEVLKEPETRRSPAGIPIARFALKHYSRRQEAGMNREVHCTITVIAAGEGLQGRVKQLHGGDQVKVSGFLSRADNRQGEYRLVIHAETLEPLEMIR